MDLATIIILCVAVALMAYRIIRIRRRIRARNTDYKRRLAQ